MIDFTTKEISESIVVIELSGKLDEMTREYFFNCVEDVLDGRNRHVIVDCSGLGIIGSSGLASLLRARKQASKNGGGVYLTHVDSMLADMFEKTGLGALLAIYPTTEKLLEQLSETELAFG